MALSKRITLANGVTTNYHRVVSVNAITNVQNIIEVASYTSKAKRVEEQEALVAGEKADVFISTSILSAPYDQSMTVVLAYEWIKTLPEYEGATDVLEDEREEVGTGV